MTMVRYYPGDEPKLDIYSGEVVASHPMPPAAGCTTNVEIDILDRQDACMVNGHHNLIFCGDFCSPIPARLVAEEFEGDIHCVFGNGDGDRFAMLSAANSQYPNLKLYGEYAELEFEGVKVLSSVLRLHGHETDCFITSEERDFHQAVLDWRPEVEIVQIVVVTDAAFLGERADAQKVQIRERSRHALVVNEFPHIVRVVGILLTFGHHISDCRDQEVPEFVTPVFSYYFQ